MFEGVHVKALFAAICEHICVRVRVCVQELTWELVILWDDLSMLAGVLPSG